MKKIIVKLVSLQKESEVFRAKIGQLGEDIAPNQDDKVEIKSHSVRASKPLQENEETKKKALITTPSDESNSTKCDLTLSLQSSGLEKLTPP